MHTRCTHTLRQHLGALCTVLCWQALALLLFHALAGGTLLEPNVYDSYSLQAENWLRGRLDLADGARYSWLELAVYKGRFYQSFPPVPGVLLLPWVIFCGGAAHVPANLVIALLALCCTAGVYACFWQADAAPHTALLFAVLVGLGSNVFWLSTSGGVWFMAQVSGLCFAVWGIFWVLRGGRPGNLLASFCFAAAVGCRPFYALLFLLWGLALLTGDPAKRRLPELACATLPAAVLAAAMMAYNAARFGNVLEFGHNYLPEFSQATYGQFSTHYLVPNLLQLLRPVTLDSNLQLHFPLFNGFLPFVANPLLLLAVLCGLRALLHRDPALQQSHALPLPASGLTVFLSCLLVVALLCLHKTLGGWQFGARYTVDLFPFVLLWFLARPHYRPGTAAWALCGCAVLFNLYGAVYMLGTV